VIGFEELPRPRIVSQMYGPRSGLLTVVVVALLTGCGSSASNGRANGEPGKFDQTWSTPYSQTTCAHWGNDMDNHQKFVMAADMLIGAWESDGIDALPPDEQIQRFVVAISRGCRGTDWDVTEMAAAIYLSADDLTP
jgi:hypothetical protein